MPRPFWAPIWDPFWRPFCHPTRTGSPTVWKGRAQSGFPMSRSARDNVVVYVNRWRVLSRAGAWSLLGSSLGSLLGSSLGSCLETSIPPAREALHTGSFRRKNRRPT
jgi:hypothetical protein